MTGDGGALLTFLVLLVFFGPLLFLQWRGVEPPND